MNAPDPKANTTTEAYLAYKAGYLEDSELKPKLYEPYLHFDGWLAYWAGLTETYPNKGPGKNQMPQATANMTASGGRQTQFYMSLPAGTYTISFDLDNIEFGTGSSFSISMGIFGAGGTQIADVSLISINSSTTPGRKYKTFTISSDGTTDNRDNIRIPATDWNNGARAMISNIQIEAGSTATEYEPYTIIPEMLTDEEALVAYLAGVTDTYPEEIKDPYDVRIVGYLKHLASVRWPEPDYPVNNEEFYLSTMEPTHTSSPEPSADIELDTAEGKIISVEAYGDTKQQAYSGKNLCFGIGYEAYGVTSTYDSNSGLFTVSGTPTSTFTTITANAYENFDAGTYTFSTTEASSQFQKNIRLFYADDTYTDITIQKNETTATGTLTAPAVRYNLRLLTLTAGTAIDDSFGLMLEKGSTATSFEPYVGGIPSPNPDYPQDVNVVTGRQQINVSGKNLLDTEYSKVKSVPGNTSSGRTWNDTEKTMEYNGITYKFNEDGTITVSGSTGSAPSFLILNGPIENLQEGSEYYMSGCPDGGSAASYSLRLYTTASTYTPEIGNGLAFTYGEQPFIRINISAGIVADDLVFKPMIVNSSDAGDEFVPFQGYESYEINLGKNLLDASTNVEGKRLDASGNLINDGEYFTTDFIKVSPSTKYTYSRYASGGGSTALCTWKADGTFIERIWWGGVNNIPETSFSFTTGPDVGLVKICDIKTLSNLQLELGSTSSSYAPYSAPIELCKIGDYQDYIYKNGDDWYLHKETGGQNITSIFSLYSSAGEGYIGGIKNASDMKANSRDNGFCNKLTPIYSPSGAVTEGITFGAGSTNQNIYIILQSSRIADNTVEGWNTYLTNNPYTVYYPLDTPTDTQITDSTLISQLDALADADTYNEKTYIRVVANDPNLPALLKVEAYKY